MNPPPAEGIASRLILSPALRAQPDRRLVSLVRDGYDTAFEEIVRRYGKALRRYAAAIVGGRSDDVVQDSFSKALQALRRDRDAEIDLRPWLYRIVRNTALNDLRDSPPIADELVEDLIRGSRSAAEEVESREELVMLLERLRSLPDPQRAAIVMRELEGLGHDEIAAALGLSGGAARQAIYRARQALRDGLGMLIPLPLLRALSDHGAETGAAAGAGGAAIAAGAGGAGGATALKVGLATAVLAGSLGTGLAIERDHGRGERVEVATAPPVAVAREAGASGAAQAARREGSGQTGAGERGKGSSGPGSGEPGSGAGLGGATSDGDADKGPREGGHQGPGPGLDGHQGGGPGPGGRGPGPSGEHVSGSGPGPRQGSGDGGAYPSGEGGNSGPGGGGEYSGSTETGSGEYSGSSGSSGPGGGDDAYQQPPPPSEPIADVPDYEYHSDSNLPETTELSDGGGTSGPG
jgi:RNA polymerase sigma factor (sigma-70 family)